MKYYVINKAVNTYWIWSLTINLCEIHTIMTDTLHVVFVIWKTVRYKEVASDSLTLQTCFGEHLLHVTLGILQ